MAPAASPRSFRRRLLHGRGSKIASLLDSLPNDAIEPEEFRRAALRAEEGELTVVLLDRALHGELAPAPPAGIGEGAERLGVV
ncbi:MAG TPA: hypothetical protein VFL12_10830, partial [Thermoanaerobaculia bacterium]|nr:hypothetical protein [Thermoanaerobaculia bacterium]